MIFRKFTTRQAAEDAIKNKECVPPIIEIRKHKPNCSGNGLSVTPPDKSGFYAPESNQGNINQNAAIDDLFDKLGENKNNYKMEII